jgi:hypothetical protein
MLQTRRVRSQMQSSHTLDQPDSAFDDTQAVANAGPLLAASLARAAGAWQAPGCRW